MNDDRQQSISVIIPTFNGASTISATLQSVLSQTVAPIEILVMDDGSTDNTAEVVASFAPSVVLFRQDNKGISAARNALIRRASGRLIALLDHDDLWHPQYLEIQSKAYQEYPNAVVRFTGFQNFYNDSEVPKQYDKIVDWKGSSIEPHNFLELCNKGTGFVKPSFCVFKSTVLRNIEPSPLPEDLRGTDDLYLWYRLALLGPFVRIYAKAGFYRIQRTALSQDRILQTEEAVKALRKVYDVYHQTASPPMIKLAKGHLADNCRWAAKFQMGINKTDKARCYLIDALKLSFNIKSLGLLIFTYFPRFLQPRWPQRWRIQ